MSTWSLAAQAVTGVLGPISLVLIIIGLGILIAPWLGYGIDKYFSWCDKKQSKTSGTTKSSSGTNYPGPG